MLEFKCRSNQQEWIDIGNYTQKEYQHCLTQLGKVGKFLGGDRANFFAFQKLAQEPNSVLDVGCGGGFFTRALAERYQNTAVLGIDISKSAIRYAQAHHSLSQLPNLKFKHTTKKLLTYKKNSFDVLISTLTLHHMSENDIILFLRQAKIITKKAIIINDLHRSLLAYLSFAIFAYPFFKSRLMYHDGLVSINKSFTKKDWQYYLSIAGFHPDQYEIHWKWPYRWIIIIKLH
jgi:2-polyprenyl-3-methyl-5-hydroxy-6-metoxy-1,4-benzoquinol methylase